MDYFEQIVASPEGGTASLHGQGLPTRGYFVGGLVSPLILDDFSGDADWNVEIFASYLTDSVRAHYLGWWTDGETGKIWVDGTTWHATELEAGQVGRERREIAIYDVASQRELRLQYVEGE